MIGEDSNLPSSLSRRRFLWLSTMLSAALDLKVAGAETLAGSPNGTGRAGAMPAETTDAAMPSRAAMLARTMIKTPFVAGEPRIGMIGLGLRGTSHLENLLAANAKVVALCDVVPGAAEAAGALVTKAGQPAPMLYTKGPHNFEALTKRTDLDLVLIATPWNWHAPMALSAMENGKHAAVEVPMALTVKDLWSMVDASEKTRRHCIMLENCCYGQTEMLVLNLVRAGLLGTLLYGEAGYLHDLREILFEGAHEGLWRRAFHTQLDGNLYPTHGLGPVANYMGINRGDRLDYMVSMSSPQRGLDEYRQAHVAKGDPKWAERYVTGDLNTSLLKTKNGLTITLKHDVSNPRPYDRINMIGGTKGAFVDYPPRLFREGQASEQAGTTGTTGKQGPHREGWEALDPLAALARQYEHPLWKKEGEMARKLGGHGGMDYIMSYRLLQCMREGLTPDMDVYDGAAWSAPGPLSRLSLERKSAPVDIPDFTRGMWKERNGSAI